MTGSDDLISRYPEWPKSLSEDLDLKIGAGTISELPTVFSWKSEGKKAVAERKAYFEQLPRLVLVPGATVELDPDSIDKAWRGANLRVVYPGRHLGDLQGVLSPFVRLEVGSARVTPFLERDLSSFVHEKLLAQDQLQAFADHRPRAVRCVHPLVTLLEKLDALRRRFPNDGASPATFVRHYEEAAPFIRGGVPRRKSRAGKRSAPPMRRSDRCSGGSGSLSTKHARPCAPGSRPSSPDETRRARARAWGASACASLASSSHRRVG